MRRLWQTLALAAFTFLVVSMPSEAESRGNDFADVDFYLSRDCVGENCDLAIEEPMSDKPKHWVAQNDPPVQN